MAGMAVAFLVLGVLGLLACGYLAGHDSRFSMWGAAGINPMWVAVGIVCLFQGVFFFVILSSGAEIIRLLKKLNGIPFGGEISKVAPVYRAYCSDCEKPLAPDEDGYPSRCPHCEVAFSDEGSTG